MALPTTEPTVGGFDVLDTAVCFKLMAESDTEGGGVDGFAAFLHDED